MNLPEKINPDTNYGDIGARNKINEILDYLASKESEPSMRDITHPILEEYGGNISQCCKVTGHIGINGKILCDRCGGLFTTWGEPDTSFKDKEIIAFCEKCGATFTEW